MIAKPVQLINTIRASFSTSALAGRWHRDFVQDRHVWRFGYKDKIKQSGALPRLKNDSLPIKQKRIFAPMNPYSKSQALMGQNDYIDILGHPDLTPSRVHYHIPGWLRGFGHGHHFQALIRKNNVCKNETSLWK